MHTSITFRHMESSEALKAHVRKHIHKLKKYLINPIEMHVVLGVEKFRHVADITLVANGVTVYVKEESPDMYTSVDMVFGRLERQMRRTKERQQEHKHDPGVQEVAMSFQVLVTEERRRERRNAEDLPRVIRKRSFTMRPMPVGEAILQMETLANHFFVFRNVENGRLNVLHKVKEGDYRLLDPRAAGARPEVIKLDGVRVSVDGCALPSLSIRESMARLQEIPDGFLMFTNRERTGEIGVLYRRKNGEFALIEPEA